MTTTKKIAQKRLALLQLAERLRNVSERCRLHGVSRSQFYESMRVFQERGFEGLMDRAPIPKSYPHETPPEIKEKLIVLSLQYPAWGPVRIADYLRLEGVSVSSSTVWNIWVKENIDTKYKRLLRLEEKRDGQDVDLSEEQIRLLEKANPCFRERRVESPYLGYLLCQDTFMVCTIKKGIGRIYLQAVVDTYGSFAFGKLYTSKLPETAVDILYDRVLPFYEAQQLIIEHIRTDNGREFCGRPMIHLYEIFLELNDIEHRRTQVGRPQTNGFVGRFNRTVPDEFLREAFWKKLYGSVQELQDDFDRWLYHYNYERAHQGYRNRGKRPIETIEEDKLIKDQVTQQAA